MPFSDPQGVPAATYRLQLRLEFPFAEASALVPHLHELGISHCYCSPILMSTPGSTHGYDVNDYRRIDPELGGRDGFARFAQEVRARGMGILLDFVPNHMGINGGRNAWWLDVLECGPESSYAEFFDIGWRDLHSPGPPRVLVPILDSQYGIVLEQGRFKIAYDGGEFAIRYEGMAFPLSPLTYAELLAGIAEQPEGDEAGREKLRALAGAFRSAPQCRGPEEPIGRRHRDNLKRQFAALAEGNECVRAAIDAHLIIVNGKAGEPRTVDRLDALIRGQNYRLAHWKTGVHEVNYRRLNAECRPEDAREIEDACAEALRRNPRRDPQPFIFVRDVLVGRYPPPSATAEYREGIWRWVLTWQQYTGAIMAKAVVDTAFYVYNRFIAHNEMGGEPSAFGGGASKIFLQGALPAGLEFHLLSENRYRAKTTRVFLNRPTSAVRHDGAQPRRCL